MVILHAVAMVLLIIVVLCVLVVSCAVRIAGRADQIMEEREGYLSRPRRADDVRPSPLSGLAKRR
jgi:hypothetical protein